MSEPAVPRNDAYSRVLVLFRKLLKQRLRRPTRRRRGAGGAPAASYELQALVRHQLSVEQYLEIKMAHAMEPLRALLHDGEISRVQACLREHVRTQPTWRKVVSRLGQLVRHTGS